MADYTQPKQYMRYFAVKKIYYLFLISNINRTTGLKNNARSIITEAFAQVISLGKLPCLLVRLPIAIRSG